MVKQWTMTEFSNLNRAAHLLSNDNKRTLGLLIPVDVYVQDPLVAQQNAGLALAEIDVACEPDLMDGPTSALHYCRGLPIQHYNIKIILILGFKF